MLYSEKQINQLKEFGDFMKAEGDEQVNMAQKLMNILPKKAVADIFAKNCTEEQLGRLFHFYEANCERKQYQKKMTAFIKACGKHKRQIPDYITEKYLK